MTVRPLDRDEIATVRTRMLQGAAPEAVARELRVPVVWVKACISDTIRPKREIELERLAAHTKAEREKRLAHRPVVGATKIQPTMADLLKPPAIPKRDERGKVMTG